MALIGLRQIKHTCLAPGVADEAVAKPANLADVGAAAAAGAKDDDETEWRDE